MKAMGLLLAGIALLAANQPATVCAETETVDLKALAKKARPAVMLLVVSDANGKEIATGTGFLVSSDGKLITNFHVIEKAASAVAKAENGGLFPVEGVLASDPKNDLVLLKLKAKDLPFLTLGKSENLEVGTRIAVIGSPLGLEGTLSEGIVSARRKASDMTGVLQVTAAISRGSSGSPVMNAKGEVVGVASWLLRGGQALNFAVPVEYASGLLAKAIGATPQPLQATAAADEDKICTDPDWQAGMDAFSRNDFVEMLKRTKILVARYPDNRVAWHLLGMAFGYLNFHDDAIAAYRQAVKLKPDDVLFGWDKLGSAYEKAGRMDDAIAVFQQAVRLNPDSALAWSFLGGAYKRAGRMNDATDAFQRAKKLAP